ncbi:MAG: hypothetical protein QG650_253, partial [Patescibacteria group bacterium]|nr:hypothetical protein [Patescibacteria group bacterium]
LILGTNNSEQLRITSGGNVGIGTTTPSAKLEVNGAITAANVNQAPVISTTNRSSVYTSSAAGWQYMGTSVTFTVPPGPNRKYRITSKAMGYYTSAGNYMLTTVANSTSSSVTGVPTGMGSTYEYMLDT